MLTITYTKPRLAKPARWDGPGTAHYLFGTLMQVSPTQAVVFINLHQYGLPVDDLEAGVDAVAFDDLDRIDPTTAIPVARNTPATHPRNGRALLMVRPPIFGGFVPLGARLADGKPHPHAGTGFGMATVIGYPADHSSSWPAGEADLHVMVELQQYRFDGKRFEITASQLVAPDAVLTGWSLPDGQLSNGIPDGEDFLLPIAGGRPVQVAGSGVSRWRRERGEWRAVSFTPVTPNDTSCEPSLVRVSDGALLFSVRGARPTAVRRKLITQSQVKEGDFQVWRSTDNGVTWEKTIDVTGLGNPVPVVLNRTVGGRAFLASNPLRAGGVDRRGQMVHPGGMRCAVWLWPINDDFRGVGTPTVGLDCDSRFGPSPGGSPWLADHPTGAVIRLADGRWRSLLCTRVAELAETTVGASITEHSGAWIDEVIDTRDGRPMPPWTFD